MSLSVPIDARPDFPICFVVLPIEVDKSEYKSCCGSVICNGCIIAQRRSIAGLKNFGKREDCEFEALCILGSTICPFCRSPDSRGNDELFQRLKQRIDKHSDSLAMVILGQQYKLGLLGLPKCPEKAKELFH